jgi:phage head maturation protease
MTVQPKGAALSGSMPMQIRLAPAEGAKAKPESRDIEIVVSTGASVRRSRWEGWDTRIQYDETLRISKDAVNLTRAEAGAVMLLDSHRQWGGVGDTLGKVTRMWVEGNQLLAEVRLHDEGISKSADALMGMIRGGTAPSISVGYSIDEVEVKEGEKRGDVEQWDVKRWTVYEVSFVSMPADTGAGLRAAEHSFSVSFNRASKPKAEEETMAKDIEKPSPGVEPGSERAADPAPASAGAGEAEHSWNVRDMQKIQTRAKAFGLTSDDAVDAMQNTRSLDDATDHLQRKAVAAQSPRTNPRVEITRDEVDTRRSLVENAIAHRANPGAVKLEDGAREWRGLTLMEMARDYLSAEGVKVRGLGRMEVAGLALGLTRGAGMLSTSDFPLILANVADKRLRAAYEAAPSNWRMFCRQANLADFKARYVNQLSEAPRLEEVKEHAEYKYGKVSEQGVSYALKTYGKIIAITRQTLINDDLGAFDRLPTMFGQAAADNEADIVWAVLTSNPTMGDNKALFHSDHGNLAASGAAISIESLGLARAAMRKQKGLAAKQWIDVMADFLLVPPELETVAEQYIAQIQATQGSNVNTAWMRSLTPIVEPRLSADDANAWYLAAKPERVDTIEYAYLEGQEGVYTETRMGFEVDGMELKARHDFAAKAIDWRGFYKNAGPT